jgi:hypothetical protein
VRGIRQGCALPVAKGAAARKGPRPAAARAPPLLCSASCRAGAAPLPLLAGPGSGKVRRAAARAPRAPQLPPRAPAPQTLPLRERWLALAQVSCAVEPIVGRRHSNLTIVLKLA